MSRPGPAHVDRRQRWLAGCSVVLMLLSAGGLVAAVRWEPADPRADHSATPAVPPPGSPAPVVSPPAETRPTEDRAGRPAGSQPDGGRPEPEATPRPRPRWREVLARLDRLRADAYAAADPGRLGDVYTARSRALREDRALVRRYQRRGLRVVGLRMRVVGVEVLRADTGHVVLHVTDRVAGGTVLGDERRHTLSERRVETHTIELRRSGGGWRISAVRPV